MVRRNKGEEEQGIEEGEEREINQTSTRFSFPFFFPVFPQGINLGLRTVHVSPFGPRQFSYHVGNIHVDYDVTEVVLTLPGKDQKVVSIDGMRYETGARECVWGEMHIFLLMKKRKEEKKKKKGGGE